MERDENGVLKWTHAKNLYRDWGSIKACLKAFSLTIAICFALVLSLIGCAGGMKSDDFLFQCKIWGCILLGFWLMTFICWSIWAWANGGVDEWEYEMDDDGIRGRKIIRKAWRMKMLRGLAWIAMLLPARPNQKLALRPLLYDNLNKETDVSFASVKGVSFDEKKCQIALETTGDSKEIHVPREDYAEVLAYIEERLQKKKPKRQRTGGRKKASTTDSERSQRYYRLKFADTYYGEMTHYGLYRLAWADVRRAR